MKWCPKPRLRALARFCRLAVIVLKLIAVALVPNEAVAEELGARDLQRLLREGEYEHLERVLGDAERRYAAGEVSEGAVSWRYAAFAGADPRFEPQFDEWIAAMPRR